MPIDKISLQGFFTNSPPAKINFEKTEITIEVLQNNPDFILERIVKRCFDFTNPNETEQLNNLVITKLTKDLSKDDQADTIKKIVALIKKEIDLTNLVDSEQVLARVLAILEKQPNDTERKATLSALSKIFPEEIETPSISQRRRKIAILASLITGVFSSIRAFFQPSSIKVKFLTVIVAPILTTICIQKLLLNKPSPKRNKNSGE